VSLPNESIEEIRRKALVECGSIEEMCYVAIERVKMIRSCLKADGVVKYKPRKNKRESSLEAREKP